MSALRLSSLFTPHAYHHGHLQVPVQRLMITSSKKIKQKAPGSNTKSTTCVTGLCFAGNLLFPKEEAWAPRGEPSCLVSQPTVSGVRIEIPCSWAAAHHTRAQRMACSSLAVGAFGTFPSGGAARLCQWLPDLSPGHSIAAAAEDVWVRKGNAAGRYKQTRVRGLERMGLLILQRSLVLVVTATSSPLQKP